MQIDSTAWCRWSLECHRSGDGASFYMRLPARTPLSRYWRGMCDWNMQSRPLRLCGASSVSHEVGARSAIESFWTKQALEVLREPLVTLLARYIRLKIDNFSKRFSERARSCHEINQSHFSRQYRDGSCTSNISTASERKTFNPISCANIVTSGTRNISKAWSTSKNFQSRFSRQYRD